MQWVFMGFHKKCGIYFVGYLQWVFMGFHKKWNAADQAVQHKMQDLFNLLIFRGFLWDSIKFLFGFWNIVYIV